MLAERVKTWTEEWKAEGLAEGLAEGRRLGAQEGRQAGRREGRQEGEARVLRKLLVRRFGPLPSAVEARLVGAGEADLERWTDRLLDARTLDDIFDDAG